jgi:hypothetical protein
MQKTNSEQYAENFPTENCTDLFHDFSMIHESPIAIKRIVNSHLK